MKHFGIKAMALSLVMFLLCSVLHAQRKHVVLVDLSGSMEGMGFVETPNTFGTMKDQLKTFVQKTDSNTQVVLIPFTDSVSAVLRGTSAELAQAIDALDTKPGKSDLAQAWHKGLSELSPNASLILISDGLHNAGPAQDSLFTLLRHFPQTTAEGKNKAYYLLLADDYKGNAVAHIFDQSDNMECITSLDALLSAPSDTASVAKASQEVTTAEECWALANIWWILLVILIILLIVLLVWVLMNGGVGAFSLPSNIFGSLTSTGQSMTTTNLKEIASIVPSGNRGINAEKRTIGQIVKEPVVPSLLENLSINARISKEAADNIRKDITKYAQKAEIPEPSKNGSVDFSKCRVAGFRVKLLSYEKLCKEIREMTGKDPKELSKKELEDTIRNINYKIAHEALAKKYNITPAQAKLTIGALDCVLHESEEGYIELVPNSLHNYRALYKHYGYVSKAVQYISQT